MPHLAHKLLSRFDKSLVPAIGALLNILYARGGVDNTDRVGRDDKMSAVEDQTKDKKKTDVKKIWQRSTQSEGR